MPAESITGNIVDVLHERIFPGRLEIEAGSVRSISQEEGRAHNQHAQYILPGFVDAHVHIESSLLVPSEFARLATVHGTVATVSDPHEIANVLGLAGVRFMLANAVHTPFSIAFGAPSCVPATHFETAGAQVSASDIARLFESEGLSYLSEMMNVPGVLARDPAVMEKIQLAHTLGLPVDGHAPGLRGPAAQQYAAGGICTDHECQTHEEALDKLAVGMKIILREGSAARNYAALHPLIASHPGQCMFCSDDQHPDSLSRGHINTLVQRSVALGYELMNVLHIACVNPVLHYGLNVGLLRRGDPADFIVVNNLQEFNVQRTYCKGSLVAEEGKALLSPVPTKPLNHFAAVEKRVADFFLPAGAATVRVIEAVDGQVFTRQGHVPAHSVNGEITSDIAHDVLKLAVVNRYTDTPPAVALVKNFGLQRGALASSVAHDSHNIVAVGTTNEELCAAVNAIIRVRGGLAVAEGNVVEVLPLPLAGLMSTDNGYVVAKQYSRLDARAKQLGSTLSAPFMALSFMALLVIPELKLSDKGLFSSTEFRFVPLHVG